VSYGSGVSIPSSKFSAKVSGQILYVWYGFQDAPEEVNPNYDFFWKLTVSGSSPLVRIETTLDFTVARRRTCPISTLRQAHSGRIGSRPFH